MYSLQHWIGFTRLTTLIISIFIVLISLYVYNQHSASIQVLMDPSRRERDVVYDIILDRRLIATLVASQASIFCQLFLLMNTHGEKLESTVFMTEQFFQCLMPIGLAISWFFCITFNQRVNTALKTKDYWTEDVLKNLVVIIFIIESILICIQSIQKKTICYKKGDIQLPDEEECTAAFVEK